MKNIKLISLLVLVAAVWGVIGFKVYNYLSEETTLPIALTKRPVYSNEPAENYELQLNYPDPFLKTSNRSEQKVRVDVIKVFKKQSKSLPEHEIAKVDWGAIQYLGMITNTTRENRAAIVKWQENEHFVKEGEMIGDFRVVQILPDSLRMEYKMAMRFIKKEKK